jgi:hypothetical protein
MKIVCSDTAHGYWILIFKTEIRYIFQFCVICVSILFSHKVKFQSFPGLAKDCDLCDQIYVLAIFIVKEGRQIPICWEAVVVAHPFVCG